MNPESNINLENDKALLEQKKDKCLELFKTSSLIHDILQKSAIDLNSLISLMFADKHFINCKVLCSIMNRFDRLVGEEASSEQAGEVHC